MSQPGRQTAPETFLGYRLAVIGCGVLSAPVWVPLLAVVVAWWVCRSVMRRLFGWYGEAWFVDREGESGSLPIGHRVDAPAGSRVHVSKRLHEIAWDPARPAYRVRTVGAHQPWPGFDRGFEARSVVILEAVPGWRTYGPSGDRVVRLVDEATALPMSAFATFPLVSADPAVVLRHVELSPLHDQARHANLHAASAMREKSTGDPEAGYPDHGDGFWTVTNDAWVNAIRAVQLAVIAIVLGEDDPELMLGWRQLREHRPEQG